MIRLFYVSLPSGEVDEETIRQIVSTSNDNNMKRGVTGALAFNGHAYGQILEGDRETVTALMNTIARDERHHGLIEVCSIDISERAFYDWGMNYLEKENFNDFIELMAGD